MKNIRAIIRKSSSVALASAMVLSSSGFMTYAATSDVQNTISAIEQSYGIDSAKYAQDISANVYEGTDEPQADTVSSGKWGTCDWNINDGVLTISGGVASGSVKDDSGNWVLPWSSYLGEYGLGKVVIEDTITFENNASLAHLFDGWQILQEIDGLDKFDTSNVTDMSGMFDGCSALITIDVSNFDTSNVTSMSTMFNDCKSLTTIDVSNFDTGNVKGMWHMFSGCKSLTTIDVSNFDTSNVINMSSMFSGCESLTTIDVSNFDTSKVIHMGGMFYGCSALTTIDLSKLDLTYTDICSGHICSGHWTIMANYLSGESGSLKKIIMPSALGKEENIKTILNDMYTIASSWTDKTANKVYAEKPDTLIAGHTYVVTGSEYDKTEL